MAKIVLMKKQFNTGPFAFDEDCVDTEITFSLYINKSGVFFNVNTGDFSTNYLNPFKAFMRALEHSQVAAIKYLRLKEKLRDNGMWKKL